MRSLQMIGLLVLSMTLLTGCNETLPPKTAATLAALKARCGQPTQWTPAEKREVAALIRRLRDDPAMQLLAGEWDRETDAIRICREGKGK